MDGAGAEHDLARADLVGALPFDVNTKAGRPAVADQHAIDQRVPANLEIGTAARRLEIALVGRDAAAVAAVDGIAGDALAIRTVEVGAPGIAARQRRIAQAAIDRAPLLGRSAIDRQRSAASMARGVTKFQIILDHREQWHHVLGRPAGAAIGGPFVERVGDAADGNLAVHHR